MRRSIFETDANRIIYLQLLDSNCQWSGVSVIGFCLMSNHVHLIVVPRRAEALSLELRHAHDRYASYWNARRTNIAGRVRRCTAAGPPRPFR